MTDQERNQLIARKLGEGMSLSDLQKLLKSEYGLQMTYLELRLLAAELPVDWGPEKPEKPEKPASAADDLAAADDDLGAADDDDAADDLDADTPGRGRTTVSISKLVRPGAAISGDVVFASGAKAEWFVDTMGRLGLNPAPGSARPTQDDLRDFQTELQRQLSGMM
ncbi:MAG: hypothetical protein GX595_04560 [Lentisphaerae bacterium]|nr:hypothetical protein [Lentisphaerota bacterium]